MGLIPYLATVSNSSIKFYFYYYIVLHLECLELKAAIVTFDHEGCIDFLTKKYKSYKSRNVMMIRTITYRNNLPITTITMHSRKLA